MKPGFKSTEMWITLAVVIMGALLDAHVLGDGSTAQRIVGAAMAVMASLGYTAARTSLKKAAGDIATPEPTK